MRHMFADVDALVLPTTPHKAFDFETGLPEHQTDLTGLANHVGFPAVAVPTGFGGNGMPLSMQIITRTFQDDLALQIACAYEEAADHDMWP